MLLDQRREEEKRELDNVHVLPRRAGSAEAG